MFKKQVQVLLLLSFTFCGAFAQMPNISFNGTNSWSTNSDVVINTALNQATIRGNGNNFNPRTTLNVALASAPSELYFVAEVKLTGVAYNSYNIKNPQLTIRNSAGDILERINLEFPMEGRWFTTGVKVSNLATGAITLKVEAGINGTTGTMEVRNPYLTTTPPTFTYQFPFAIPSNVSTSINVNLSQKHNFENDILSSNTHFIFAKLPWSNTGIQNAINNYFPMSNLRFPGGTIGNSYNYTTDNFYENVHTSPNLVTYNNQGHKLGYNGYKSFALSSGATSTYMLNVMLGTVTTAKSEYENRFTGGLPMKWVELGNEMYLSENQYFNVTNASTYVTHAKSIRDEIKIINPAAKVAVCIDKDDFTNTGWNKTLSTDQTYFDAVTLHNYNATGLFFHSDYSSYSILTGYRASTNRFNSASAMFPNKPVLLTEWGVTGNVDDPYFVETLGIADMFLATVKGSQRGIVKQAGIHMLYKSNENSAATLMYFSGSNVMLTSKGVLYSKLFEVFKNSEVYNADAVSENIDADLQGVYAKMVKKGNKYKLFAVNKLPVASPLSITFNGTNFIGNYTIETYSNGLNNPTSGVSATGNQWVSTNRTGGINLPASSISIITISESALPVALFDFTASAQKNDVVLKWATATEANASHFEIEHSIDSKNFVQIDKISAAGNTSTTQKYNTTHVNPSAGVNYYRLKQVDLDNKFVYSSIKSVQFAELDIKVYPNPVKDELNISLPAGLEYSDLRMKILNSNGSVVEEGKISNTEISLDWKNFTPGLYNVCIYNNLGELLFVQKFMKQ
jgi:hypothetical protein